MVAKRRSARLRALEVRHGKGNRRRRVELAPQAERAVARWDELRRELGPPPSEPELAPSRWPLSSRWSDAGATAATYARAHRQRDVVDGVVKRLGGRVGVDEDLRHAHVLRHTFATATTAAPKTWPGCSSSSATPTPSRR